MIELLDSMGSDNTIANTARVSMQFDTNWPELPEGYTVEQRDKLIAYLADNQHTSPFRHTAITIRMKVPIFLARQLGKHQVGMSWNEVSRRYVQTHPEFFDPIEWRSAPDGSIKQGSVGVSPHSDTCKHMVASVTGRCLEMYNVLIQNKIAPEMARMVLPQSMMTEVIWTGSLMAFAHVYKLRIDGHAQVEAQEFAKELGSIISPLFPVSWSALVG